MNRKVVVITGASSGIGRAMAEAFAHAGHAVIGCARRSELLDQLHREISARGGEFIGVTGDVTAPETSHRLAALALERHGALDIWINNAGGGVRLADFDQYSQEEIDASLRLNLHSVLHGCQAAIPAMKKQRSGHIINVTSICAKRGWSTFSIYTAAKFAVSGFSKSLYLELQPHGIKVSVITPGQVATEFADQCGMALNDEPGDMLQAGDVATAALFLAGLPPRANVEDMNIFGMAQVISPM